MSLAAKGEPAYVHFQKLRGGLAEQECLPSLIYCAREIYGSGDDAPTPPFLDRWSANEFAKTEWLRAMQEKFG